MTKLQADGSAGDLVEELHVPRGRSNRTRLAGAAGIGAAIAVAPVITPPAGADQSAPSTTSGAATGYSCVVPSAADQAAAQVPAGGLDPSTVSSQELKLLGLPDRPNPNGPQPEWWNVLISSAKQRSYACTTPGPGVVEPALGGPPLPTVGSGFADPNHPTPPDYGAGYVVPPPTPAQDSLASSAPASPTSTAGSNEGTVQSTNWSGYQDLGGPGYAESNSNFRIPHVNSDAGYRVASEWVGVGTGDSGSDQLVQDGSETDSIFYITQPVALWVEMTPGNPGSSPGQNTVNSPGVSSGDSLTADSRVKTPDPLFTLNDNTTGRYEVFQLQGSGCPNPSEQTGAVQICDPNEPNNGYSSGQTSEWIVEDTAYSPVGHQLAWTGTVPYYTALTVYKGAWYSSPQLNYEGWQIWQKNLEIDYPGPNGNDGSPACNTSYAFCMYRTTNG